MVRSYALIQFPWIDILTFCPCSYQRASPWGKWFPSGWCRFLDWSTWCEQKVWDIQRYWVGTFSSWAWAVPPSRKSFFPSSTSSPSLRCSSTCSSWGNALGTWKRPAGCKVACLCWDVRTESANEFVSSVCVDSRAAEYEGVRVVLLVLGSTTLIHDRFAVCVNYQIHVTSSCILFKL